MTPPHHHHLLVLVLLVLLPVSLCGLVLPEDAPSSVSLCDGTFAEETGAGKWAVLFYSPSCDTCHGLAGTWEPLASLAQKAGVSLALVDVASCPQTRERYGVRGLPTILYFEDDLATEHTGSRDLDSIMTWLERLQQPAVLDEDPPGALGPGQAVFTLRGPRDDALRAAFEQVARSYRGSEHVRFSYGPSTEAEKRRSSELPLSSVMTLPDQIPWLHGPGEGNFSSLAPFVEEWSLPLAGELTPRDFYRYAARGRHIGVCAVDPDTGQRAEVGLSPVRRTAVRYRDQVIMGWVDGVKWKSFVGHYGVGPGDLPVCFIIDRDHKRYYMDRDELFEHLIKDVVEGKAVPLTPGTVRPREAHEHKPREPKKSQVRALLQRFVSQDYGEIIAIAFVAVTAFLLGRLKQQK
jgi:hypothetical protein